MNKSERDMLYNATKMKHYGWNMISAYLKMLVNDDLARHGEEPIFQRMYSRRK